MTNESENPVCDLADASCEACRADAPLMTEQEIQACLSQLPGWTVVEVEGVQQFEKVYKFKNFLDAMAFTQKVGELAEEEGHHPAILLEWGRVQVNWWSHKIKGLHKNDAIMAARTDLAQ